MAGEQGEVMRVGGISYLHIPAADARLLASFYADVFGWKVNLERAHPSFEDGTGHVIGHFIADAPVVGAGGIRPYVFVERIDQTLEQIVDCGGEVVTAPYPEGDLWVATFRDPAGNELGVWQEGPRKPSC